MEQIVARIAYVIDLDGFSILDYQGKKTFVWKELGVADVGEKKTMCYKFSLPTTFEKLSDCDKKTVLYVRNRCHGLKFRNYVDDLPARNIYGILKQLIRNCKNSDAIIAFKGGNVERKLLEKLDFDRWINLEDYGCPKFEELVSSTASALAEAFLPPTKYRCD